jgi:hypothetical protein
MFKTLYRCSRTVARPKMVHGMGRGVVTRSILLLRARPFTHSQPPLASSLGPPFA